MYAKTNVKNTTIQVGKKMKISSLNHWMYAKNRNRFFANKKTNRETTSILYLYIQAMEYINGPHQGQHSESHHNHHNNEHIHDTAKVVFLLTNKFTYSLQFVPHTGHSSYNNIVHFCKLFNFILKKKFKTENYFFFAVDGFQ